ncbi:DUF302 domain-containing protein, partial [Bacteroidota bacterium]
YYFSKTVQLPYDEAVKKVIEELKEEGLGVITEIDMHDKLHEKLGVQIDRYKILGVCKPDMAYKAIQAEENLGVFLPCKVIVKEKGEKKSEIVAVDTEVMMKMVGNDELDEIAEVVNKHLRKAIEEVK